MLQMKKGGKMISERDIENRLVRKIRAIGGKAYKFVSPGNAGVPDRIIALKGGYTLFVELTAPNGKVSNLQRKQIQFLRDLGCCVEVIQSYKQVDALVEELKKLQESEEE